MRIKCDALRGFLFPSPPARTRPQEKCGSRPMFPTQSCPQNVPGKEGPLSPVFERISRHGDETCFPGGTHPDWEASRAHRNVWHDGVRKYHTAATPHLERASRGGLKPPGKGARIRRVIRSFVVTICPETEKHILTNFPSGSIISLEENVFRFLSGVCHKIRKRHFR